MGKHLIKGQVLEAYQMSLDGMDHADIAKIFNTRAVVIDDIVAGRRFKKFGLEPRIIPWRKTFRNIPLQIRLSERIVKSDNGCHEWVGFRNADGYGQLRVNGIVDRAHRVAYRLYVGEIPKGMHVCHKCDNPSCCNPEHLFLGSNNDNIKDSCTKNRRAIGERCGRFALSKEQVIQIAGLINEGIGSSRIAKIAGVNDYLVRQIKDGVSWRHLTGFQQKRKRAKQ
jgi:hypothetical protein